MNLKNAYVFFHFFKKRLQIITCWKVLKSISTKTYMRTVIAPKTYPTSVAQFRLKLNGERKDPSKGPYGSSKRCNLPTLGTNSFHSTWRQLIHGLIGKAEIRRQSWVRYPKEKKGQSLNPLQIIFWKFN